MTIYTTHGRERLFTRGIPQEAIERAVTNPFLEGNARDGTRWGIVRAICGNVWKFVKVIWLRSVDGPVIVTAYHVSGRVAVEG